MLRATGVWADIKELREMAASSPNRRLRRNVEQLVDMLMGMSARDILQQLKLKRLLAKKRRFDREERREQREERSWLRALRQLYEETGTELLRVGEEEYGRLEEIRTENRRLGRDSDSDEDDSDSDEEDEDESGSEEGRAGDSDKDKDEDNQTGKPFHIWDHLPPCLVTRFWPGLEADEIQQRQTELAGQWQQQQLNAPPGRARREAAGKALAEQRLDAQKAAIAARKKDIADQKAAAAKVRKDAAAERKAAVANAKNAVIAAKRSTTAGAEAKAEEETGLRRTRGGRVLKRPARLES